MAFWNRKKINYADTRCPNCHGQGRVKGAGNWFEDCGCVMRARRDPVTRQEERFEKLQDEVQGIRAEREQLRREDPWKYKMLYDREAANADVRAAVNFDVSAYNEELEAEKQARLADSERQRRRAEEDQAIFDEGYWTLCCQRIVCTCGQGVRKTDGSDVTRHGVIRPDGYDSVTTLEEDEERLLISRGERSFCCICNPCVCGKNHWFGPRRY